MTKPTFIPPMLATLVAEPFDDPDWLFEVKWDGFRVEAVVDDGEVRLWTRGEQDAARYFGPFLTRRRGSTRDDAVVDGEVIALDDHGEPDFALLQARIKGRGAAAEPNPFVYEVFDLLYLDGRSLIDEPLEERRRLLGSVLRDDPRVRLSDHVVAAASRSSRRPGSAASRGSWPRTATRRIVPGKRTDRWQKIKIRPEQELVVGGWMTGTGSAVDLGALLVGVYEDGELRYVGKVGAGFTADRRTELLARLRRWRPSAPPLSAARAGRPCANWLRPSSSSVPSSPAGRATACPPGGYKGIELEKDPRKVIRERLKASG